MRAILLVSLGGAIGAIFRFLLSKINVEMNFPLITFLINFFGSFLIGIIAELLFNKKVSTEVLWFWQVGFCGGFTTLSTMSLEVINLLNNGHRLLGISYSVISVAASLIGVVLGKAVPRMMILFQMK